MYLIIVQLIKKSFNSNIRVFKNKESKKIKMQEVSMSEIKF